MTTEKKGSTSGSSRSGGSKDTTSPAASGLLAAAGSSPTRTRPSLSKFDHDSAERYVKRLDSQSMSLEPDSSGPIFVKAFLLIRPFIVICPACCSSIPPRRAARNLRSASRGLPHSSKARGARLAASISAGKGSTISSSARSRRRIIGLEAPCVDGRLRPRLCATLRPTRTPTDIAGRSAIWGARCEPHPSIRERLPPSPIIATLVRSPLRRADLMDSARRFDENVYYPLFERKVGAAFDAATDGWVGISICYLSQALCAFALIGFIKSSRPDLRIIIGGGLVTSWIAGGSLSPSEKLRRPRRSGDSRAGRGGPRASPRNRG
jgi:hypothetical protein